MTAPFYRLGRLVHRLRSLPPEPEPGSRWEDRGDRCTVVRVSPPVDGEPVMVEVAWEDQTASSRRPRRVDLARFYRGTGMNLLHRVADR